MKPKPKPPNPRKRLQTILGMGDTDNWSWQAICVRAREVMRTAEISEHRHRENLLLRQELGEILPELRGLLHSYRTADYIIEQAEGEARRIRIEATPEYHAALIAARAETERVAALVKAERERREKL